MVPILINDTGRWLDQFSEVLERWESILNDIQEAYLLGDYQKISELCPQGELVHQQVQDCKQERQQLLSRATEFGYRAASLRELSVQLDGLWPALWTLRIGKLEHQLNRIQQLSMGLWVTAFQSKSYVSELLLILSTGKAEAATYSPGESHSLEGGFLINEAA